MVTFDPEITEMAIVWGVLGPRFSKKTGFWGVWKKASFLGEFPRES